MPERSACLLELNQVTGAFYFTQSRKESKGAKSKLGVLIFFASLRETNYFYTRDYRLFQPTFFFTGLPLQGQGLNP